MSALAGHQHGKPFIEKLDATPLKPFSADDWLDGFIAGASLMSGHRERYERMRDEYLDRKEIIRALPASKETTTK